jgi:DNA-directed RNA polymerase specialized sigma24 family protein
MGVLLYYRLKLSLNKKTGAHTVKTQNTVKAESKREQNGSNAHNLKALSITQHEKLTQLKPLHIETGNHGDYNELTYRHVAKMFCSHLPVEGQDYFQAVESMLQSISELPIEAKHALKSAYIFSRKAPREEREDLFQDLMLKLLESRIADEKLCYAVARCDWQDWWKRYKVREHYSLDVSVSQDESGNPVTLGDLLVNEIRFETMIDGKLDAVAIWNQLPSEIKPIITKRLQSKALSATERKRLNRFVHGQGTSLILA